MSIEKFPQSLTVSYNDWMNNGYGDARDRYEDLADNGQFPHSILISCCDSRVHAHEIFGAQSGQLFMHRNIANFVAPQADAHQNLATASALEYAVNALGVSNVIVMGHTQCGGVKGCHAMCSGQAPELEADDSYVGGWVKNLRPAYERVAKQGGSDDEQVSQLEMQGVVLSLENLMSYSFIADKVKAGDLAIHGLIFDIRSAELKLFDQNTNTFVPL